MVFANHLLIFTTVKITEAKDIYKMGVFLLPYPANRAHKDL
jgi:hypothetical protein